MSRPVNNVTGPRGMEGAPVNTQQAEEMKARIEEALIEIRQARDLDQYMDMNDRAQLEFMEAQLKSTLVAINNFLITGEWVVPGLNGQGQTDPASSLYRDVQPGWNGDMMIRQSGSGYSGVAGWVEDAEFEGLVYIDERNADPENPPRLVLQAHERSLRIEAYNRGRDIVYVETYLDENGAEQKRFWIGVDHAVNIRAEIVVTAHNLQAGRFEGVSGYDPNQGITMDFHRVLRVSDGRGGLTPGEHGEMTLIGSDLDDRITGSQSKDRIGGLGGNDALFGEGGDDDQLFGDYGVFDDPIRGITAERVREELGLAGNEGDDVLDGGAGRDILQGDGGVNSGYETDPVTGPHSEQHTGIQNPNLSAGSGRVREDSWYISGEGWDRPTINGNTAEIREDDLGDGEERVLTLRVPPGYDYARGEAVGQDLRITFVGHEADGSPRQFVVTIKNAFTQRGTHLDAPFTLRLLGNGEPNIIDFSGVDFQNNNFVVDEMGDDDMILTPKNELNSHGWGLDDLTDVNNRLYLDQDTDGVVQEEDGLNIRPEGRDGDREIVVSQTDPEVIDVQINPGERFDRAYVMVNGDNLRVFLVQDGADGSPPSVLVVRIENYQDFGGDNPANFESWLHFGEADNPWGGPVIALSGTEVNGQPYVGNVILAGAGEDFVFHGTGDFVSGAESVLEINYGNPGAPPAGDPPSGDPGDDPGDDDDPPPDA